MILNVVLSTCDNFLLDYVSRPRADRFGPSMLVLSPTRELAQQIQAEVNKYSYKGITSVCVYGGGDRQTQICAFGKGVEIVIGELLYPKEILNVDSQFSNSSPHVLTFEYCKASHAVAENGLMGYLIV